MNIEQNLQEFIFIDTASMLEILSAFGSIIFDKVIWLYKEYLIVCTEWNIVS